MSIRLFISASLLILSSGLYSQKPAIEINFTALNGSDYVQLDSIHVMNRTQGNDTVLFWPDTVLTLDYISGINENYPYDNSFRLFQNYPNPVAEHAAISMYIPQKDYVSLVLTDISGRIILSKEEFLDKGMNYFRFEPGAEDVYFLTAVWKGNKNSIAIINAGSKKGTLPSLVYSGSASAFQSLKAANDICNFPYKQGDELLFIGYTEGMQSGMIGTPEESRTYTFQFITNEPCPGTPTVLYEGQTYNTIQVSGQCWLKENLNVGKPLNGDFNMTDNGVIEKYCLYNDSANCDLYGGLYQWDEAMQYTNQQGTQGICPPGWHFPTDEEWKVLEGAVDSLYHIGDTEWDNTFFRGYNAGTNLKSTSGWLNDGNGTDLFGFTALPGGMRDGNGIFGSHYGEWWTSSETNSISAWLRSLSYSNMQVYRVSPDNSKNEGRSVRCLKDN
jgi:uncharacterized protein (TIGR02145 family)